MLIRSVRFLTLIDGLLNTHAKIGGLRINRERRKRSPEQDASLPVVPRHRPLWRGYRRVCICGLAWPCQDRARSAGPVPHDRVAQTVTDPPWNDITRAHPHIGLAALLNRGQEYRADGRCP